MIAYAVFSAYFLFVIIYSFIIDDWNKKDTIKKHLKLVIRSLLWPIDILFTYLMK